MKILETTGSQLKENDYDPNTCGPYRAIISTKTSKRLTWPPTTRAAAMKSRTPPFLNEMSGKITISIPDIRRNLMHP